MRHNRPLEAAIVEPQRSVTLDVWRCLFRLGSGLTRIALKLFLVVLAGTHTVMAQSDPTTEEAKRQAHLDEFYPFIEQGSEPPGRAVPSAISPALSVWEGQRGWRTRHGQAVVRWDAGRPSEFYGAQYPNGLRGEVRGTLDHGYRRRSSGDRSWVYGTVDIRPDDVVFIDNPNQPVYVPPQQGDEPNLERDLANDPGFLADLKDGTFAHAVYIVFRNREFVRVSDLGLWTCGDRQAARLVAALRRVGESYHDYFLHYEFDGIWPDDRPREEAVLRRSISSYESMLKSPRPIEVKIGSSVNGKLIETEEQAAQATQEFRKSAEERRPTIESSLEKLRIRLAEVEGRVTPDSMVSLRAHLTRLGWRTLNEADEYRLGVEAMRLGLILLDDIKRLSERPAGEPGAWWKRPGSHAGALSFVAVDALTNLTPEEKAVRRGLRPEINGLAATGRVDEHEYDELLGRDVAISHRIGGFSKR